jgi:CRP/FNR family transcriptional regulator, cyclic AMP receptor protein
MRCEPGGPDKLVSGMVDSLRTRLQMLGSSRLFAGLPSDALETLALGMKHRQAASGEMIFARSDEGTTLFGILTGQVRIVIGGADGREQVLRMLGPGEMFGEISVLDGRPRSADATAVTKCRLLLLERRSFLALIASHPAAALRLVEILCERLRDTTAQIEGLLFHSLSERLAAALLDLNRGKPSMSINVTQTQLGQLTGVTRESVNKKLRAWQADGLVELQPGRVRIVHAEELKRLLSPSVRMMAQTPSGKLRREAIASTSSSGPMKSRKVLTAADARKARH